jgi:hypothetical protein
MNARVNRVRIALLGKYEPGDRVCIFKGDHLGIHSLLGRFPRYGTLVRPADLLWASAERVWEVRVDNHPGNGGSERAWWVNEADMRPE